MGKLIAVLAAAAMATPTVAVHGSQYGRIVFDGRGYVLYAFTRDGHGPSRCYGACAKAWPPYVVKTRPHGAYLGVVRRRNGGLQLTYAGRPLYYYVGDRKPGQILCQNVSEYGGLWLVVKPDGTLVR